MFPFLNRFLRAGDNKSGETQSGSPAQKLLLIVVTFVVLLCFLVHHVAVDELDAAYRSVWVVLAMAGLVLFFCFRKKRITLTSRKTMLVSLALLAQLMLSYGVMYIVAPRMDLSATQVLLVLPYTLAPTVAAVMIGNRLGVFIALCSTILTIPLFPQSTSVVQLMDYIVISLLTAVVSVSLSGKVRKREQILYGGFATGFIVFISVLCLGCLHRGNLDTLADGFELSGLLMEMAMALTVNFLVTVVVNGVMPLLEKLFNLSTHITWLEWADMNHPILKKLQIAAPGTFHHSLYVQRLSEAAAEAIGADVTRAGVCALYHDIGKINNPQYFAENIPDQTFSPHNELTPEASARIITSHVTDGVELAREYKLNPRIANVIREHHGVSTAYFFYRKAQDQYQEDMRKFEEGLLDTEPNKVDISTFSYKGPIPQTRESGIVSMADAVESATRSLLHPTEDDIRNMIDSIFKGRILDGHLQDSHLTLGDIAAMKESFFKTLRTMNHNRIAYPAKRSEDLTSSIVAQRREQKEGATQE